MHRSVICPRQLSKCAVVTPRLVRLRQRLHPGLHAPLVNRRVPICHATTTTQPDNNDLPNPDRNPFLVFFDKHKAVIKPVAYAATACIFLLGLVQVANHGTLPFSLCCAPSETASQMSPFAPLTASLTSSVSSASALLSSASDVIWDRLSLFLNRLSTAPVWVKLTNIFAIGLPLCFLLGRIYAKINGLDNRTATLKMYALLYRAPGGNAINEKSNLGLLISNLAYFGGLFVFAVLIGFVGDEIKSQMKSAKSGDYALHHRDHLLVLNWNRNTVPLLRQIASARSDPGSPYWRREVVVMANKPKSQMDAEVASGLRDFDTEVHTRQGVPFRVSDLKRVNAAAASTVILLHADDPVSAKFDEETMEANKTATLMSLCSMPGSYPVSSNLLVQGSPGTPRELHMVESIIDTPGTNKSLQVLALKDKEIINRMIGQTAMQPGLANVYSEIIQQGKGRARALFQKVPHSLQDSSYGTVRRSFKDGVVIGFLSSSTGKLVVNPADDVMVGGNDKLLLLARHYDVKPHRGHSKASKAAAVRAKRWQLSDTQCATAKPRKIIIVGWSAADLPLLLGSLEDFAIPGSSVTVVTKDEVPEQLLKQRSKNCSFRQMVVRYPTAVQTLLDAGIKDATAVVVGGLEEYTDVEAESRVLAALVQVQDASHAAGRSCAPHVVAKVRQPNTAKVARQYLSTMWASQTTKAPTPTAEFLLPEEFISALISQVAGDADYELLIQELINTAEGQEIYLHSPELYNIPLGTVTSFTEVRETARLRQQTALGFLRRDGTCVLVPDSFSQYTLKQGDQLIVLAEDYRTR